MASDVMLNLSKCILLKDGLMVSKSSEKFYFWGELPQDKPLSTDILEYLSDGAGYFIKEGFSKGLISLHAHLYFQKIKKINV